jgi:hypothetical protein
VRISASATASGKVTAEELSAVEARLLDPPQK